MVTHLLTIEVFVVVVIEASFLFSWVLVLLVGKAKVVPWLLAPVSFLTAHILSPDFFFSSL